ncbi:phage NrS-1 polymerase family protein [Candidatus Contendibacter odensensis]|nr:hypothetical protein [Candidatus Contendobacter odensis]
MRVFSVSAADVADVAGNFISVPTELRTLPQWVCWHYEDRNGKPTKPPISAQSNGKLLYAKSNDPSTWADFDTAVAAVSRLNLEGIGLCLSADDGLTGLDLDHVLDPETLDLDPMAVEVLEQFAGTYIEISPSGTGLRIWCYGQPQRSGKCSGKTKWLEVYSHPSNRYLTLTGNRYGGAFAVTEQQSALDWLHQQFMVKETASTGRERPLPVESGFDLDDTALLTQARQSKNGRVFDALWAGDLSGQGGDASSADLALCNALAFWTDHDAARMDRLFRQSGLMRPKWDEIHYSDGRTYGQGTLDKAMADGREGYSGKRPGKPTPEKTAFKVCGKLDALTRLVCLATDEASAKSIHECTDHPVVIAGVASQLWSTANKLREAYPQLKILVCGDSAPEVEDKARIVAFSLIGGSYWCNPHFLNPGNEELRHEAIRLMKFPPQPGEPLDDRNLNWKQALANLNTRDTQRIAEESPATFAALANWFEGKERVRDQIEAAVDQIGVIKIRPGKLPSIVDRAEKEALFFGADFYQRVGMLVRPVKQDTSTGKKSIRIPAGALVLKEVNLPWLNRRFSQSAQWVKFNKEAEEWLPADPPPKYAETLLALAGEWRAPVLTGIIECPTLRREGSLLTQSGYDEESGLYVDYTGDPIRVPDAPTSTDARAALEVLKEPFSEFPFAEGDVDLSVALAGLLTAIVRRSLRTAPLFAFDAPVMGAGKGLIVNTIAMVATGRAAPAISQGKDEAEDEKRLGALLLQGVPLLNIDNIERDLQGDLLCSALTETSIAIRILGKSEVPNMPSNVAMFATGNNLRARGDMVRRMLVCRIDPACERPDARAFQRNLNEWVPANRARLLSAALTVLRAYIVAGKPKQDIPPYGSFEEWSGWVRSALVWAGMPDPNLTRTRLEADDAVTANLHSILTLWFAEFGKNGMTAAEMAQQAGLPGRSDLHRALLEVAVSRRDSEKVDALRLGHWLKRNKGKIASGLRLEKAGENTDAKIAYWRVSNRNSAKFTGDTGVTGTVSLDAGENWKELEKVSESNFLREWVEQYPLTPVSPVNPQNPAAPPPPLDSKPLPAEIDQALRSPSQSPFRKTRDIEEF